MENNQTQTKKSNNRKPISKKIRFEIFKRDSFTCQYCGMSAPDVKLEVDHIIPYIKTKDNSITNLITSCFNCNRGKKANLLSDTSIVRKQQKQLKLLNEKRQQLKLLVNWKNELDDIDNEKIKMIIDYWNKTTISTLTESGISSIKKLIKKYDVPELIEAINITNNTYNESQIKFDKLSGILYNRALFKKKPEIELIYKIFNQIKYKWNDCYSYGYKVLESLKIMYYNIQRNSENYNINEIIEELEMIVNLFTSFKDFKNHLEYIENLENHGN